MRACGQWLLYRLKSSPQHVPAAAPSSLHPALCCRLRRVSDASARLLRSYLFLGGILSSAISAMMLLRLGSWMFGGRSGFGHSLELYGGLAVFIGYVLFDTQVHMEAAVDSLAHQHVRLCLLSVAEETSV